MAETLLTAIIFAYNHEKTIGKCIESLLNQKTNYPYEIHICEDCSKDSTTEICKEYAQKYPDKIRLFAQSQNTGLRKPEETHFYHAIQRLETKYWCYIDGDDWWCDENKVQISLDFLEQNPDYMGFCHDTIQRNEITGEEASYVHECFKFNITNKIEFKSDAPFLLTSSRIFRDCGFKELKIQPIDYVAYYYHLSKGPFYYYDKKMAVYNVGNGHWTSLKGKDVRNFNYMFPYKLAKLFDFKQDDFCTEYLKYMTTLWSAPLTPYKRLKRYKRIFGIKLGWHLWFITHFVRKYGLECMDINWVSNKKDKTNKALKKKKGVK